MGYSIRQIESGYGEILVSLGLPGLACLAFLVFVGWASAWSPSAGSGAFESASGLVAISIATAGFNAFEGQVMLLLILLLLVAASVYRPGRDSAIPTLSSARQS
jgi:O-antigen ligase